MLTALIDFDIIAYKSAASAENEPLDVAIYRMENLLDYILTTSKADSYIAYLGSDTNFRKNIYFEYKANRTQPKPKWLEECKKHAIEHMEAIVAPEGLEADDCLGIEQMKWINSYENHILSREVPPHDQFPTVICSIDKDLLTLPGKHYQWIQQGGPANKRWEKPDTFYTISEIEGWRRFYTQCLTGDSSDNIKGVVGVGKVGAEALMSMCETEQDMFNHVREAYGNDDEFIMNASCLYILRSLDDSFKLNVFDRLKG